MELHDLITEFVNNRQARLDLSREVKKLEEKEIEAKYALLAAMEESHLSTAGNGVNIVNKILKRVPVAEDWRAIYDYVLANDAFDCLQRRLGEKAIRDRVEEGEVIPGVGYMDVTKLTVSKAK